MQLRPHVHQRRAVEWQGEPHDGVHDVAPGELGARAVPLNLPHRGPEAGEEFREPRGGASLLPGELAARRLALSSGEGLV